MKEAVCVPLKLQEGAVTRGGDELAFQDLAQGHWGPVISCCWLDHAPGCGGPERDLSAGSIAHLTDMAWVFFHFFICTRGHTCSNQVIKILQVLMCQ